MPLPTAVGLSDNARKPVGARHAVPLRRLARSARPARASEVGAGSTGDPRVRRGRLVGPGSPKGFGSYRSSRRAAANRVGHAARRWPKRRNRARVAGSRRSGSPSSAGRQSSGRRNPSRPAAMAVLRISTSWFAVGYLAAAALERAAIRVPGSCGASALRRDASPPSRPLTLGLPGDATRSPRSRDLAAAAQPSERSEAHPQ